MKVQKVGRLFDVSMFLRVDEIIGTFGLVCFFFIKTKEYLKFYGNKYGNRE